MNKALLLEQLKKQYKEITHALDPYLAQCFSPVRLFPADFEERLKNRAHPFTFSEMQSLAATEESLRNHTAKYAHPTEALLAYFASSSFSIPPEFAIDSKNTRHLADWIESFQKTLLVAVTRKVYNTERGESESDVDEHTIDERLFVSDSGWKPPCRRRTGCNFLCSAVCCRINVLHNAWKIAEHNERFDIMHHAILHVDTYMNLLKAWELACPTPQSCTQAMLQKLLESAAPSLRYAFTDHNVPDMSIVLPMAFTYNSTQLISNKRNVRQQFPSMSMQNQDMILALTNMVYKYRPQRCANRQTETVAERAAETNVRSEELLYKIVVASWLGVYPWCRTVMDIPSRVLIYTAFCSPVNFTDMFTNDMAPLMLCMGKEFFWHLLLWTDGVREALQSQYDFESYRDHAISVNEVMRVNVLKRLKDCDYKPQRLAQIFSGIHDMVSDKHEKYRTNQTEKMIKYNLHIVMDECIGFNFSSYKCDAIVPIYGRECTLPSPFPQVPEPINDAIRDVVQRFPYEQKVPMDWLVYFPGVKSEHVKLMTEAVYQKIPDLRRALRKLPSDAYAIFWTFFRHCRERSMYYECLGDANMFAHHVVAMKEFHGTREGDFTSPIAGQLLVCPNCKDVKRSCVFEKMEQSTNSTGVSRINTTSDGKLVCGCRQKPASYQKTSERGKIIGERSLPSQIPATQNRSMAKTIYLHQLKDQCRRTELIPLNVRGRVTRFNDFWYIGCYVCLRTIQLEHARYKENKLVCDWCYNMFLKDASDVVSTCRFCLQKLKPDDTVSLYLYDDDDNVPPDKRQYKLMGFCRNHGNYDWVKQYQVTPLLSLVKEGLRKRWGMYDSVKKYVIPIFDNISDASRHGLQEASEKNK